MSVSADIASARALLEKAEREANPELKALALEEAVSLLSSIDAGEISDREASLIANLRMAHTRRLLAQLVALGSVSLDAWFDYVHLLFSELRPEVERLIRDDPQLKDNYARFIELWGPEVAKLLQAQQRGGP